MKNIEFTVFAETCPSRKVLEIISNKWTILIIQKISQRPFRFGELRKEIGGISKKVLTESLRSLERNGFLLREEFDVIPLKVEYSITTLGFDLNKIFAQITKWSEDHITQILEAQKNYLK